MLISDWISDVCSSDLGSGGLSTPGRASAPARRRAGGVGAALRHHGVMLLFLLVRRPPLPADRKSVVLGKSVSVRVDLGGSRIIKKKISKVGYYRYSIIAY